MKLQGNRNYSVEIISDNPKEGLLSKETVVESELENYIQNKSFDCKVNVNRILSDERCKYFKHFMPANTTSARNSYKENHQLHKAGNFVKIYISQVFDIV